MQFDALQYSAMKARWGWKPDPRLKPSKLLLRSIHKAHRFANSQAAVTHVVYKLWYNELIVAILHATACDRLWQLNPSDMPCVPLHITGHVRIGAALCDTLLSFSCMLTASLLQGSQH
jgi:hypothetical protein